MTRKVKLITLKDLDNWGACNRGEGEIYSDENLKKLLGKKKGLKPIEIAEMEIIPLKDRIWVLLRRDVLGDAMPLILKDIVAPCVEKHCLRCGVKEVEEWARKWLDGEDRAEDAAWAAARAAGAAAAARAAEAAAWAARAAARAAWAAAEAAAWAAGAAAWAAAARAAAETAERTRHLEIIKKYLEKDQQQEEIASPKAEVEKVSE